MRSLRHRGLVSSLSLRTRLHAHAGLVMAMAVCSAPPCMLYGQTSIASAYQSMTCRPYAPDQSYVLLACAQGGGFASMVGPNSSTGQVEALGTVQDMTVIGKKPFETYTESIFIVDSVNGRSWVGMGTFESYAAVVKSQSPCGATHFVAGVLVNATLTTNDNPGGSIYFIPRSQHNNEAHAEKAAAAISSEDPGETGDYPPGMSPDLTVPPPQTNPDIFLPARFTPDVDAPADHAERAAQCYLQYRAACRTAFTTYKNALATARASKLSGSGAGAGAGAAVGGGVGLVIVGFMCVFTGPPGWAAGAGIITVSAAAGGAAGAIGGPVLSIAEAKQTALAVFNNDMDSARAAYIKCLESAGYKRND